MATTASTPKSAAKQPRPRGAARREALLEAVLRIVADVGADAVTHRRVAEVADLPLASTTYWFDSKEQLLTAALELAAQRDMARLQEFIAEPLDNSADPLDLAVAAILEPLDESLQASRGSLLSTYLLLLEAARRPNLRGVAKEWTAAYMKLLNRLFRRAGSNDPVADAELLLAAADGLLISQLAQGTAGDLAPRLRRLADALVTRS
jgi:TetR/AcrR family transcriptional regulator, regulator of biofilm formation and stress response